jgi:hemolysin D
LAFSPALPRARLLLREDGLPRLEHGQVVQFFFEAFPYQRYGTVTGELTWISPAAATTPDGPRFTGYARLHRPEILVEGDAKPLQVGMNGQARIRTGERTLLEFAFEPLRQLRENAGR